MTTSIASYPPGHTWRRSDSRESIYSMQGHETDLVRDTTDTESDNDKEGVEYEPVTDDDDDDGPTIDISSDTSDGDIIRTRVIEVSVGDDRGLLLADSERGPDSTDSEIDYHDYWHCASCRATNNDPAYRYCQKCFKVRKNLFPPRPRRKTRRVSPPPALSQDSGVDTLSEHSVTSSQTSELTESQKITQSQELVQSQQLAQPEPVPTSTNKNIRSLNGLESKQSRLQNVRKRKHSSDSGGNHKRSRLTKSDFESESDFDSKIVSLHKTNSDPGVSIDSDPQSKVSSNVDNFESDMCITCLSEPKSGVFVHGRIAHICCCYKCAIKVWRKAKRCPICNSRVSNVLKAVVM